MEFQADTSRERAAAVMPQEPHGMGPHWGWVPGVKWRHIGTGTTRMTDRKTFTQVGEVRDLVPMWKPYAESSVHGKATLDCGLFESSGKQSSHRREQHSFKAIIKGIISRVTCMETMNAHQEGVSTTPMKTITYYFKMGWKWCKTWGS